jgi:hypothetical protein
LVEDDLMIGGATEGDRLKFAEDRRKAAEATLWQLPSVSIAAQAFLLGAGLDHDASDWTRIIVGVLGLIAVVATACVVAFQGARTSVLGRWIELQLAGTLDERKLAGELGARRLSSVQRFLLNLPTPFWFWALVLVGFAAADVYVLGRGL